LKANKKGQMTGPWTFLSWGLGIVFIIILFTIGATVNKDTRDDSAECNATNTYVVSIGACVDPAGYGTTDNTTYRPGNYAYNISISGDEALTEGASKTKTIMMVVAFSIIIALLLSVAYMVGSRK